VIAHNHHLDVPGVPQLVLVPQIQEQSPHPSPSLNTVTTFQKQIAQRHQDVHGSAANVHSSLDAHLSPKPQIPIARPFRIDASLMELTVLKLPPVVHSSSNSHA